MDILLLKNYYMLVNPIYSTLHKQEMQVKQCKAEHHEVNQLQVFVIPSSASGRSYSNKLPVTSVPR